MSARQHPFGCTCRTHVDRPWDRSEHWTRDEVAYLERSFGLIDDERLSKRLGRSIVGIRLKAKRLGLHKRAAGFTARDVAAIFKVDEHVVTDRWIAGGMLPARSPFRQGPSLVKLVPPEAIERFIREHPEQISVDKMPPSPYRDMAALDPWISLPEAHRRTGRDPHKIAALIRAGTVRGRRRGAHWYMPLADVPLIPPLLSADAIEDSWFRRQSGLAMRRNRRKGSVPRLGDGQTALPVVHRIAS